MTTAVVRVPATSANLGAGFDCVGVAVNRALTVSIAIDEAPATARAAGTMAIAATEAAPTRLARTGTLANLQLELDDDYIAVGFRTACARAGRPTPALAELRAHSEIPVARGLGSSAAALLAGAAAANALLGLGLDEAALLDLVADLEGHPENAAAALYGGAVLALHTGGRTAVRELTVSDSLAFVFAVPSVEMRTAVARTVLPKQLPYGDAVHAASKAAALIEGLATADGLLLHYALDDVLHVPFRRRLVPAYGRVTESAISAGAYGATLSGSGSTIVAVCPRREVDCVADAMQTAWHSEGVAAESFSSLERVNGYQATVRRECEPAGQRFKAALKRELRIAVRGATTAFTGIRAEL